MDKLYDNCLKIVRRNTKIKDSELVEILSLSIMSLFLTLSPEITKKIPRILKGINIYSDNRSVVDVAHEELNNYGVDEDLDYAISSIVRNVRFIGNRVFVEKNLIIPRQGISDNPIKLIEKTTHELIHLLRYGDVLSYSDRIELHDGVAVKTIDKKSGKVCTKNKIFEEAIVQKNAKDATITLLQYLDNTSMHSRIIDEIVRKKDTYKSLIYDIPVSLLEEFLKDDFFMQLVKDTFNTNSSKKMEFYLNAVLNNNCAFLRVSDAFDKIFNCIQNGDYDGVRRLINYIIGYSTALNKRNITYKKS